jgi:hypothetical protein
LWITGGCNVRLFYAQGILKITFAQKPTKGYTEPIKQHLKNIEGASIRKGKKALP